ncbi:MAG: hypothetical protein J5892_01350 [Bacilli bacterium]|nr:hypothetical protein [Bacilli bacterium]
MERRFSSEELEKAFYPITKKKFDYLCGLFGVKADVAENGRFIHFEYLDKTYEIGIEPDCDVRPHIGSTYYPHSIAVQKRGYRYNSKNDKQYSVLSTVEAPAINVLAKDVVSKEINEETYTINIHWNECPYYDTSKSHDISVTTSCIVDEKQTTKTIDLSFYSVNGEKNYDIRVTSANFAQLNNIVIRDKQTQKVNVYARIDEYAFADINAIINRELGMSDVDHYMEDILPVFQLISDYIDCDIKSIISDTKKEIYEKRLELKNRA